jgi:hypothetical protein
MRALWPSVPPARPYARRARDREGTSSSGTHAALAPSPRPSAAVSMPPPPRARQKTAVEVVTWLDRCSGPAQGESESGCWRAPTHVLGMACVSQRCRPMGARRLIWNCTPPPPPWRHSRSGCLPRRDTTRTPADVGPNCGGACPSTAYTAHSLQPTAYMIRIRRRGSRWGRARTRTAPYCTAPHAEREPAAPDVLRADLLATDQPRAPVMLPAWRCGRI